MCVCGGGGAGDQSVQRSHSRWDSHSSNETEQPRAAELWACGTIAIDSSPAESEGGRSSEGSARRGGIPAVPEGPPLSAKHNYKIKNTTPAFYRGRSRDSVCVCEGEKERIGASDVSVESVWPPS